MKKKITIVVPVGPGSSVEVLESLEKYENRVDYLIERGTSTSGNRNKGIDKAKTSFVGFVNAHTFLSDDWVEKVEDFFLKHPNVSIVGGPQLNCEKDNLFAKISGFALGSFFGAGPLRSRYKEGFLNLDANENHLTSANLICRKEVFDSVRFDQNYYPGEDPKFLADAKSAGFKIAYSPEIKVYNKRRHNSFLLIKQMFNYGKVRPKKEGFFGLMKKPFFFIPSLFFLYLLFLPFLGFLNNFFVFPLLAYVFLNIFFTLYEAFKQRNVVSVFLLPFLFLMIHLSYGVGCLYGLFFK